MKIAAISAWIVNRKSLIVIFLLLLFTIIYSLFTGTARADHASPVANPAAPSPQPCINALNTNQLTDNYVTDENGKAAVFDQDVTVKDIPPNTEGLVIVNENYVVDFSKLQGIFGAVNSNFQEGNYQDDSHRKENIIGLNSQDFNKRNGPIQKLSAKSELDESRKKYVEYIYQHPHLPEASGKYTDNENTDKDDPKTIYDLVQLYGLPDPPARWEDQTQWLQTWGKYWEKIPTSYSEFYRGYLQFRVAASEKRLALMEKGERCPLPIGTQKEFIMPEFKRTVSISDQVNRIVVPCAAQSFRHGSGPNPDDPDNCFREYLANNPTQNQNASVLGKFIKACKDIINGASKTLIKQLRNAAQTSFKILSPIKVALAAPTPTPTPTPIPCLKRVTEGKEGNAPFCAFPEFNQDGYRQLDSSKGEQCVDSDNPNKLDKNNPNVKCIFNVSWSYPFVARPDIDSNPEKRRDDDFDECEYNSNGNLDCIITVKVWPVYQIPFLSEIWNDTLYSNENEGGPGAGVGSPQLTGRPGVYSNFIPKAIYDTLFPNKYTEALTRLKGCTEQNNPDDCVKLVETINKCLNKNLTLAQILNPSELQKALIECAANELGRNLPGEVATDVLGAKSSVLGATSDNAKERFIGATDCGKVFTRDFSLKPKALQNPSNIDKEGCNLKAAAVSPEGNIDDIPLPVNCPASFDHNPHQTTVEELQCYIVDNAAGQTEPKSGKDLARVMLNVMNAESSGDQCAIAGAGEIGVFQYIASTWQGYHPDEIDSGSVNSPCWGVPGTDPYPTNPPVGYDINLFIWPSQFSGTNDGRAWDPFLQIDTTIEVMLNNGACNWTTYKLRYGGC